MPFGVNPVCKLCGSEKTVYWRKIENQTVCDECYSKTDDTKSSRSEASGSANIIQKIETKPRKHPMVALRKSARSRTKVKQTTQNKFSSTKGKSRRIIFKQNVSEILKIDLFYQSFLFVLGL